MARTRPRVQIPQAPLRTALKLRWQSTRLKPGRVQVRRLREPRGCSSMAEPHPSKVRTGVRFPVAARSASSTMALHLALNQEVLGSNPRGRTSAAAHGCGPAFVPRAVRVGTGRRPRPGRPTAGVTALRPPDVRVRVPVWTPRRYARLRLRLCNPERVGSAPTGGSGGEWGNGSLRAFEALRCASESRFPSSGPCSSMAEHVLGKDEAAGSVPAGGSLGRATSFRHRVSGFESQGGHSWKVNRRGAGPGC